MFYSVGFLWTLSVRSCSEKYNFSNPFFRIMFANGFKRLFGDTKFGNGTAVWFALHQGLTAVTTLLMLGLKIN